MARYDRGQNGKTGARSNGKRQARTDLPSDELIRTKPRRQASRKPLEPLSRAQVSYINAINVYDLVFSRGPAGTGKTYVAAAMAAEAYNNQLIDKIIITRPAVGAGEEYGFFPGELEDKVAPWAKPVVAILEERLGAGAVEYMLLAGKIEIAPLGLLRGTTFNDAWVLGDEMQNATPTQMKLFLTRFGQNCKMIVDGDPDDQQDIIGQSGFEDAWRIMEGHPQVGFIQFTTDDIVRSGLCRDVLIRYSEKGKGTVGHAELRAVCGDRPH